jgi:hypothetical protein
MTSFGPHCSIRIYEVGPLPDDARIRPLGEMEVIPLPSLMGRSWICGDRLFLQVNSCMVVWNFCTQCAISWFLSNDVFSDVREPFIRDC